MGGTFNGKKVLPGTYINYKAKKNTAPATSTRGIAVVPLVGYDWGDTTAQMIAVTGDSPDGNIAKFGRSVYADNALIRYIALALENAATVYAYVPAGGNKASKATTFSTNNSLTVTAKYGGTRGNKLKVSIVANPASGFDVSVFMDGELVEKFEKFTTVASLVAQASEWVTFSGEGNLAATASIVLENGTDASVTNTIWTNYLDALEKIKFNTALVPVTDPTLKTAAVSKVNAMRNTAGKTVQFVCVENAADNIGIINVINSFGYGDSDNLTIAQAAAWVTGAEAGADKTVSCTYKIVPNADRVVGELGLAAQEAAVNAGQQFFSVDDQGAVILTYDINSLVNPDSDQDDTYKKNRVLRTLDAFADDLRLNIRPNMFDNNDEGWDLMTGIGKTLLANFLADGAIKNVNPDEDFVVDKTKSTGDNVYFDVALQPVDSAEKIYITINTQ